MTDYDEILSEYPHASAKVEIPPPGDRADLVVMIARRATTNLGHRVRVDVVEAVLDVLAETTTGPRYAAEATPRFDDGGEPVLRPARSAHRRDCRDLPRLPRGPGRPRRRDQPQPARGGVTP